MLVMLYDTGLQPSQARHEVGEEVTDVEGALFAFPLGCVCSAGGVEVLFSESLVWAGTQR